MGRLKFKFHPTFVVFAMLLVYFGQGALFVSYFLTIILHELSHAVVARHLGYETKSIKIIPFGVCLNINSKTLLPDDEIKIALAGPLTNLVISLVMFSLWWIIPASYNATYLFCYSNIVTCLFNLLPAFPLDGGRVLRAILRKKSNERNSIKYCKIINIVLSIFLLLLFVFSCFVTPNYTYLLVIFCVLSGIFEKNEVGYEFLNCQKKKYSKKILKIRSIYVKDDEKLYKICKFIDNFSYLQLYIYNSSSKLVAILSENEFFSLLDNFSATEEVGNCINKNKVAF